LSRRLLATYLALTLFVLLALEIPLGVINGRNEKRDLITRVERDAVTLASISEETLENPQKIGPGPLRRFVDGYSDRTGGRVVIVDSRGFSIVDTSTSLGLDRSFASRPEIAAALAGRVVSGERYSRTLGRNLLYVAVPAASGGIVHGAVRITYPTSAVDERALRYWLILVAAGAVVLALAAVVGLRFAGTIAQPLKAVQRAARRAGGGDLTARAPEGAGPPEVQELARSFNEMVARIELLLRSQQEFVGDASHELRTPLTALRLRLENLESEVGPEGRGDLDAALDEVDRLSRLVEELLALARADAGAEPAGEVDLAEVAAARIEALRAIADEEGVTLRSEIAGRLVARAGRGRIGQVLDNLLANALEASPAGTTIAVTGRREGAHAVLRVLDEGRGMTGEERQRAFDRFWRGRASRPGGSGLGLPIVRRLVELDGGSVELRAREPRGTEAVVRLPAARA